MPSKAWYGKNESYFETEFLECIRLGSSDFGWQDKVQICGLTELGKQQEELVIPSFINGYEVTKINYKASGVSGFYGAKFKKVFAPSSAVGVVQDTFGNAPVDKILYLGSQHPGDINLEGIASTWLFVPSLYYDADTLKHFRVKPANISFLYNYEESSNRGYWWIDDLDEGEPLKTKTSEPEREGYTFEGWFYEEGCINMADLSTFVKTKHEEETIFYAKWEKI